MAANSWVLVCAMLTLRQVPSDVLITNQRALSIPVNIQESRRAELRELVLYASNDQGRTWSQVAAMLPTQTAFTFNAPIDGSYWLRVAVVNHQGKQEPENLYQGPPNQKVVIDTMKPLLRLKTVERQGDEIAVAWELQEDNPDWPSFQLEYQPKDGGPAWTPIQATAGLTGQARFRPTTPGPITVRLSFRDKAENQAFILADVIGLISTTAFNSPQIAQGPGAPPAPMFPGVPTVPLPGTPAAGESPPPLPPIASTPVVQREAPKTFPPIPPSAVTAPWNAPGAKSSEPEKVVASTQALAPATPAPLAAAPRRELPLLQYVNHPDVTLEYELKKVGPSGVGSIDLWWTQNDGQTWELYAKDPEGMNGTVANGKHKRTLELPGDGVYGFVLVVKSKAGLGKPPPRAGDVPDIRIEVDTTGPIADLYVPQPDPQKINTLLLKWSAHDHNLTSTPIYLEWSVKREGPWQAIAQPLPNTGKYSWQLPDNLPVQVYLRMRVRDLAGNESAAVTSEPQVVDLSEPEGRLTGVTVSPR
jgi:hypothetical protein